MGGLRDKLGAALRTSAIVAPLLMAPLRGYPAYDRPVDIHPEGWTESAAVCINARGDVAGFGATPRGERGFVWSGGTVTVVLPPGADSARASWVNRSGDIAGTAETGGVPHAFLLKDGKYMDPTPGWAFSTAVYVGEDGTVAGTGEFGAYVSRGGATEILGGFSAILGGNSAGQLIGRTDNAASLYIPGKGYVDVTPPLAAEAFPGAINDAGLVAVTSSSAGVRKGFVYSGGWFILMTPAGWESSQATAVTNLAIVAGFGDFQGTRQSFVRSGPDYEFIVVPGWSATEAVSLNDAGQVVGSGTTTSGERHAFIASPAGVSAPDSPAPGQGPGPSGGGGCSVAPGAAVGAASADAAASVLVLGLPLLVLAARRLRR